MQLELHRGTTPSTLVARRAATFADHGISDWGNWRSLTSTGRIRDSADLAGALERRVVAYLATLQADRTTRPTSPRMRAQADNAATIMKESHVGSLMEHPDNGNWHILVGASWFRTAHGERIRPDLDGAPVLAT
jgi:hypothetical protein